MLRSIALPSEKVKATLCDPGSAPRRGRTGPAQRVERHVLELTFGMDPRPGEESALEEFGEALVVIQRIFGSQPCQLARDPVVALDEKKTPDDIVAALVKSWERRGQA